VTRRVGALALVGVACVTVAFLVLPVAAVFLRVPPGTLAHEAAGGPARDALLVTLRTGAIAQLLILALGTPTAWLLASRRFRGRELVVALVELPIVLPPAVAGLGLLAAFGRFGLLGSPLRALDAVPAFTAWAVVLAVVLVAGPLYVRQAIAAFEALDPALLAASRTLGASPARTFFRVALPLARTGLVAGLALSVARGLGEFGATIMFAGSLRGVTQTLPLAVYAAFAVDDDPHLALALGAELVLVSAAILLALKLLVPWRSPSTSRSLVALSSSR
jgi:molybdate transport system permease protein